MAHLNALEELSGKRVGIVAGWGSFPVHVAQRLSQVGCTVVTAGLKGHAGSEVRTASTSYRSFGVLKLGAMLRYFRKSKVEQVVFAGKIFKDRILHSGLGWIGHAPDLTCVRVLGGSFITRSRDGADDTILSAVTEEFLRRGIEVLTIQQCAPDILVEAGVVGNVVPSIQQNSDIDFGWKIAKGMGGLDVGQSIIVKDQMVIAVEAVEGTDSLVKRSAELCPRGGFTLIKVAKPNQDMRFDVPTVGVQTIRRMAECGGRAIAIDADKTIMVDREQTIALANALGIAIVALRDDQIGLVRQTSNQDSTKRESELSSQATTGGLSRGSYPFNRYRAA